MSPKMSTSEVSNHPSDESVVDPGRPRTKLVLPWTSSAQTVPGPGGGPRVGAPLAMEVGPQRLDGKAIRSLREVLPRANWGFSEPPVAAAEANCTRVEDSQKKKIRGAYIDPLKIVAFIGCPPGVPNPPPVHPGKGPLLDWHGHVIGRWWIASQLMKHDRNASEYPIVMEVGGRRYCGTGDGVGHICKGERVPSQKAQSQEEHRQYAEAAAGRRAD